MQVQILPKPSRSKGFPICSTKFSTLAARSAQARYAALVAMDDTESGKIQPREHGRYADTGKGYAKGNGFERQSHEIHRIATREIDRESFVAVRHYTADTDVGQNMNINGELRHIKGRRMNSGERATKNSLDRMFSIMNPLEKGIRVFRGIPLDLAESVLRNKTFSEMGFLSTTTSLGKAKEYSGKSRSVLIMNIPKGCKAISVRKISRKPEDQEILVKRGYNFVVSRYNRHNGINFIYLEFSHDSDKNG